MARKIVIDEQEANADIKNIECAMAKIAEARALLDAKKLSDANMLGSARTALDEILGKFCSDLKSLESECMDTNKTINQTVAKYKRVDKEIVYTIQGAQ
jgi:hypothetical protein